MSPQKALPLRFLPQGEKKREKPAPKSIVDEFNQQVIVDVYTSMLCEKLKCLQLRGKLHTRLIQDISYDGSKTSLRRLLRNLGFKWKRTQNNRTVLIEKQDIRLKRTRYLRQILQYRQQNRPIIYVDETYIHSTHTAPHCWSDDSGKGFHAPISKGPRVVIVHAGGETGFVPNALLMFKSKTKSGDYHDDMNSENFIKWLRQKLIPNLPPSSVLVLDNASYHNIQLNPAPTSNSLKADMQKWLQDKGIHFPPYFTKPELYELVNNYKPKFITYQIDSILSEHGHSVVRLPPYHPELNAIEGIWALVKNWIASRNVTFKMNDVLKLAEQKFNQVTADEWASRCRRVREIEREYLDREGIIDDYDDGAVPQPFIIQLETESQSSESGENLSGIEKLLSDSQ